jgi:hypothetical protein
MAWVGHDGMETSDPVFDDEKHQTPYMDWVEQDGLSSLTVVFNREMDRTKTDAMFRTCDIVNGVVDWTGGTWIDGRTFVSTNSNPVMAFNGTRRAIYLSGTLRAKGRYRVNLRTRCDCVEDV